MSLLQSIFLGFVQGVTEFLPVSSSGHLAILRVLFGINTDGALLYSTMVHMGTVIAICIAFHKDIRHLIAEALRMLQDIKFNALAFYHNNRNREAKRYRKIISNNYRRFLIMIFVSTIPTAIIGYVSRELISMASSSLLVPGVCLLITAIFLIVSDVCEAGKMVPKDISFSSAFLIGIAQGISALPGLSRSGITIAACLISGYDKRFAVRYSFIMSIPAIIGATIMELHQAVKHPVPVSQFFIFLAGAFVAGGVGYLCIKKMIIVVRQKRFKGFTVYCLVLGLLSMAGYVALG